MSVDASVTITPKIKTADQAVGVMTDFAKNPPTSPQAFLATAGKMFDVNGTVSAALSSIFPGAGALLPALGQIFGLFGGGGPSIGEVTLQAIQNLGKQLDDVKNQIIDTLQKKIDDSALKTINVVLSGIDEVAKEQSAAIVFQNYIQQSDLIALQQEKQQAYAQFLQDMQAARASALNDLQSQIAAAQKQIDDAYNSVMLQVQAIAGDLTKLLKNALQGYIDSQSTAAPVLASRAPASLPPQAATAKQDTTPLIIMAGGAILAFLLLKKSKKG